MAITPNISFVQWLLKCGTTMLVTKVLYVVSCPRCTAGPNIVGSWYISLHTTANTDTTTPNIVDQQCWELLRPLPCSLTNVTFCFCGIVGTMINWKQWRENFQFQNHRWAFSTLRFNPFSPNKRSFSYRGAMAWNQLPNETREMGDPTSFKLAIS